MHKSRQITATHGPSPLLSLGLLLVALAAFILSSTRQDARADEKAASSAPTGNVQEVIGQQLDAIRTRDAERAFALTMGALHEKYADAAKFLEDLRFTHRALYNHSRFRFLDQIPLADGLLQKVEIEDGKSGHEPVLMIYRLRRDEAGHWRIDSFTVLDEDGGKDI